MSLPLKRLTHHAQFLWGDKARWDVQHSTSVYIAFGARSQSQPNSSLGYRGRSKGAYRFDKFMLDLLSFHPLCHIKIEGELSEKRKQQ